MATMNLVKAAVKATMVAVVFAGPMAMAGSALASAPVASETSTVVAAEGAGQEAASGVDGSGQDSGVQAYCYWQTYCDFYGYCWTNWVCF